MAIIKMGNISVEIIFYDYSYEWVDYRFNFLYGDKPIFNPEITQNDFFFANEYDSDSLINSFEKALKTDGLTIWELIEPDLHIVIQPYHKKGWEDHKKDTTVIYTGPKHEQYLKEVDAERVRLGGKLPDDYFELVFFVDTCQLKEVSPEDDGAYQGDYVGLKITVERNQLEEFVSDLKNEYKVFCEKHKDKMKKELSD